MNGSTNGPGPHGHTEATKGSATVVSPAAAPVRIVAPQGVGTAPAKAHGHDACEQLHDRMLGELVLRHVAGQRVLDLGRGVPLLTQWVSARAASLQVVDAVDLGRSGEIALPFADDSVSVVYCVRTLPHLGRDAETAVAATASALAEIGRILAPGGTALVEIDNALSLWGAMHGLRRPAKALEPGPMVIDSPRGLTRFDTLALFVSRLPPVLAVTTVHGLRIVAPVPHLLAIPVVGWALRRMEWLLRDRPVFSRMGGHLLVVLRHIGPATR